MNNSKSKDKNPKKKPTTTSTYIQFLAYIGLTLFISLIFMTLWGFVESDISKFGDIQIMLYVYAGIGIGLELIWAGLGFLFLNKRKSVYKYGLLTMNTILALYIVPLVVMLSYIQWIQDGVLFNDIWLIITLSLTAILTIAHVFFSSFLDKRNQKVVYLDSSKIEASKKNNKSIKTVKLEDNSTKTDDFKASELHYKDNIEDINWKDIYHD